MLCDICQRRYSCLPAQMAQRDSRLKPLLKGLKTCQLQQANQPPASKSWKVRLQRLRARLTLGLANR